MISTIRNRIITVQEAMGLDIHFLEHEKMEIAGVHLKIINGKVVKAGEVNKLADFKELVARIHKKLPVAITINGRGVVMRIDANKHSENLIGNLLPGSNPGDFVYAIHEINTSENVVYIARRSFVEQVITELSREGIQLISATIGTTQFTTVLAFIDKWNTSIHMPTLKLEVKEGRLLELKSQLHSSSEYAHIEIGREKYRTNQVLALGAALDLIGKPADIIQSNINTQEISFAKEEFLYYKLFCFSKWAILTVVFCILLINFFVFNSFYSRNQKLVESNMIDVSKTQINEASNAKADTAYSFFIRAGWTKSSRYGFYADRIAALVPASVSLAGIQASPLQENAGVNELLFSPEVILVSGISKNPTELEIFSRSIKNLKGIVTVGIKTYLYKYELKAATFVIEVITEI